MKVTLHPDKNKEDSNAGTKFSEFAALYGATLEDEQKREAYDSTTPDQLAKHSSRMRAEIMGAS